VGSLTYELTLAGLAVGSAAALTGIGLVVTYRATGVLNLAHGAIAMVTAYVLRDLVVVRGWPLWPAAAVSLLMVAPALGLLLDRAVFRPLAVREAGSAETLVATLGVFVLLVGVAYLVWGGDARTDAPALLPSDPWPQLAVVVALAAAVGALTRWTPFGLRLRAVVDDRRLAVLGGIDADRVAAWGWAFGAFTAGLGGVLLAPYLRLAPYGLSLLVMETIAVAVAAGLRSLPVAIGVALAIGVAQSQLTRLHPAGGWQASLVAAGGANLFVVALLIAVLARRSVGAPDDDAPAPGETRGGLCRGLRHGRDGEALRRARAGRGAVLRWAVAGAALLLPLGFTGTGPATAVQIPALGLILLSLVVVTGLGGQISLGQAAYAGLGALFTALLAAGRFPWLPRLPELAALGIAVLLTAPLGLLTGLPSLRRRGLALALATFAVGVAVSRFVFEQPYATAGLGLSRPAGLDGDRDYYILELALLAAALLVVRTLRRSRAGRALTAVGGHEAGAAAAGARVPGLKVFTFVVGAALAAMGGGLLGMGVRGFDPLAFDPVHGLLWFAAVMVLGADSALGAVIAAALLVVLDAGTREGVAAAVVGLLAILLARTRGAVGGPAGLTPAGLRARARLAGGPDGPAPGSRSAPDGPSGGFARVRSSRFVPGPAPRPAPVPRPPAPAGAAPAGRLPGARRARPTGRSGRTPDGGSGPTAPGMAARRVRYAYDGVMAVDGVDLSARPGRVTALVGPNGAGKSTLFDCLCGTRRPDGGSVTLDGRDITRLPPHARARLGLGRTFQRLAVFPDLSVADNVRVGADQGRVRDPAAVDRTLRLLGLTTVRHARAADLPTGTLRRVELGRALAGEPRALLLDEPAAGLDTAEADGLRAVLLALAADGMALLLVEHDPELVGGLAETVYVMEAGRIVAVGPPSAVLR
jgi:ABC-type branched-subunit amino acid transport system ATPase component/branched-subunit amino acid ABC-type transport system permease component